jgi:hypothetical protein
VVFVDADGDEVVEDLVVVDDAFLHFGFVLVAEEVLRDFDLPGLEVLLDLGGDLVHLLVEFAEDVARVELRAVRADHVLDFLDVVALQFEAVPQRASAQRFTRVRRHLQGHSEALLGFFVLAGLFEDLFVEPVYLFLVVRCQSVDFVLDFGSQVVFDCFPLSDEEEVVD